MKKLGVLALLLNSHAALGKIIKLLVWLFSPEKRQYQFFKNKLLLKIKLLVEEAGMALVLYQLEFQEHKNAAPCEATVSVTHTSIHGTRNTYIQS